MKRDQGRIFKIILIAKTGTQVVIPHRGTPDDRRHLKPLGDLGQIVPLVWKYQWLSEIDFLFIQDYDLRSEEQLIECIRHSDVVVNLIGRDYETK